MDNIEYIFEKDEFKSILRDIRSKLEGVSSYTVYCDEELKESNHNQVDVNTKKKSRKMLPEVVDYWTRNDEINISEILEGIEDVSYNFLDRTQSHKIFEVGFTNTKYNYDRRFNYAKIRYILANIIIEVLEEVYSEDDTTFQLSKYEYVSRDLYPNTHLLFNLIDVSGFKNASICNENHGEGKGFGYHIHFLQKENRTNVIFLFNNKKEDDDCLYWEKHNERTAKVMFDPAVISDKKKTYIYNACLKFKKSWKYFRNLSFTNSLTFFPVK